MMKRTFKLISLIAATSIYFITQSYGAGISTAEKQTNMTPDAVLERLKEGNDRFIRGQTKTRNLLAQAYLTSYGQYPLAVVLNCMDSRTPPEIVFDQGVGDIFAIRIAGNVVNNDILGSMEFGTKLAGAKLIAVIGHTNCGAVRGACQQAKLGHLTALLEQIQPAVKEAKKIDPNKSCSDNQFVDDIAKQHVLLVIKKIKAQSPVLKQLLADGKIAIVGGVQDIATGKVTFFDMTKSN